MDISFTSVQWLTEVHIRVFIVGDSDDYVMLATAVKRSYLKKYDDHTFLDMKKMNPLSRQSMVRKILSYFFKKSMNALGSEID